MQQAARLTPFASIVLALCAAAAVRAQPPARCDEDEPLPSQIILDAQGSEPAPTSPLALLDPCRHDGPFLAQPPSILADQANRASQGNLESSRPLEGLPEEGGRRKLRNQTDGLLGSLTSQVVLGDSGSAWEQPIPQEAWQTEEAWKLDILGSVSVFGQVGAGPQPTRSEDLKLTGRTGLAWKLPVGPGGEMLLRGGPSVTCADALRSGLAQGRSELLLELTCRWPLLGPVGFEYQGSATPALSPTDHDRLNQDVRLALPLGKLGRLRLGAKHSWESLTIPRPWSDTMQLYLNFSVGQ
jgi:hypothetical protein